MKNFMLGLLDWIYKKKCYFCGRSNESVKMCSKCFDELDFFAVGVNRRVMKANVYCAGVYSKNLQMRSANLCSFCSVGSQTVNVPRCPG